MVSLKISQRCMKILRTPVYFLYIFAIPTWAATNEAAIVPASDMSKVATEFSKIFQQAAVSDRRWLEDMMIRLHLMDDQAAKMRENNGLTENDRLLTAKRKAYRAQLQKMGLDDDLSPSTRDEQKVLSDLFTGLGLDAKTCRSSYWG